MQRAIFFVFLVDANVILSQECQVRMIWSSHVISECNYRQHSGWHVTQLSIKCLQDLVIECEDINVVKLFITYRTCSQLCELLIVISRLKIYVIEHDDEQLL